ncbi:MBL fold metallo-hydrolase [Saccharospirillum impatiens]|uniref:MBL fold metallo-hydrolase n=1 Tax=Saccharospirillum impatiens TaxID=169438 RepID=UPI0004148FE8|nr:MBL fold metallo-hydrolase [Saccharospirillum impatiens]
MRVIRTFVPNSLQNFNHLVVCEHSQATAAVDPYDAEHLLALAEEQGLRITDIWITHEHGDHIRHLEQLKAKTGARVRAPASCQGRFQADHWLQDCDELTLGQSTAQFWASPGHTPGHGVFYLSEPEPALICGDTLFNAGVGNTRSGNTDTLFHTIEQLRQRADPNTRIYPGHDYLPTNLAFTLSILPGHPAAETMKATSDQQTPDTRMTTTLADEAQINLFFRLDDDALAQALQDRGFNTETAQARFTALRQLRDTW